MTLNGANVIGANGMTTHPTTGVIYALLRGKAGFRAFNEGNKEVGREVDFVALRQALASGAQWTGKFTNSLMPGAKE